MSSAKKSDPELWEEMKEELKASDKGSDPGEWSARKAQLAVQEYKKRGDRPHRRRLAAQLRHRARARTGLRG